MFTVLFFDEQSQPQMEQFSMLFAPYCSDGKIQIAKWNTEGVGFSDSFPDLFGILKGVEKWRAAFVIEPENIKCKNVYDRPNHTAKNIYEDFEYEKDYIIRAAQILGGLRRKVKTKVEQQHIEKDGYLPPPEIITEPITPSRELLEQYYLPVIAPLEIAFFSKRMDHGEKEDIEELQVKFSYYENQINSLFYERNNYPKICRFVVFDIVDRKHIQYPYMLFKFFTCLLSYAVNNFEPNLLQAYRLYTIDCLIDKKAMKDFLSVIGSRVASMIHGIKDFDSYADMPKLDPQERMEIHEHVPLVYENFKYDKLVAKSDGIGLVKDVPAEEEPMWRSQVNVIMQNFHYFLKVPDRALSLAAVQTREKSKLNIRELRALDRFQMEDFEEYVERTGKEVFEMDTVTLLDRKQYYKTLGEKDERIKKEMKKRMTRSDAGWGFFVAAMLYLLGMIPLIIGAMNADTGHVFGALGVIVFAVAVMGAGGLIMLLRDKKKMRGLIEGFNSAMRRIISEVSDAMDMFSEYLTKVCAFIKGQAMEEELKSIRDNRDYRYSSMSDRLLLAHQLRSQFIGIAECMDIPYEPLESTQYYDDLNALMFGHDVTAQLMAPVLPEHEQICLNNTMEYTVDHIDAPYRFVTRLFLYYQELFEDIPEELLKERVEVALTCNN